MDTVNLVCVDVLVNSDWELAKGIKSTSKDKWEIKCWNNAGLMRNKFDYIKRILGYFVHAFWLFVNRKKYNKIVCCQQFYGLIYAFYCRIFHVKKVNTLLITTFIYRERGGVLGSIYRKFISNVINSDYIDKIVVFARKEVDYYTDKFCLPEGKIQYLPLGISKEKHLAETNITLPEKFVLSVGRSNRDYDFLLSCADEIKLPIVVLTDSYKGKTAKNVIFYNNIRGDEYKKILNKCYAVLIPLKDPNISSGQLVMLQAMQNNKPIVITEADSIVDYVENNVTAIISKKNKIDFITAVNELIENKELYNFIARNASEKFINNFSEYALGRNIANLIDRTKIS